MKFLRSATIATALLGVSLGTSLAADPIGTWHTDEDKATVRIAACGAALCGTIISLKEANDPDTGKPKTDKNNADSGLRNRPMVPPVRTSTISAPVVSRSRISTRNSLSWGTG